MASVEYSLFRARFVKGEQLPLPIFGAELTSEEIFLRAILEKPSGELRAGHLWHIGNVEEFDSSSGYFAVGRTTSATIEKFDRRTGNFVEEKLETSPYTHCVYDSRIGILGVAKKNSLARTSLGIASKIADLLSLTSVVRERDVRVEILPIPDPLGFLGAISSARRVITFSATFKGPNPIDADELFQKPLAVYLKAARGTSGKTQIQGPDLNKEVITEVTKSTAATGNKASAQIIESRNETAVTIHLGGDPVKRKYDDEFVSTREVLKDLRSQYERVRKK